MGDTRSDDKAGLEAVEFSGFQDRANWLPVFVKGNN